MSDNDIIEVYESSETEESIELDTQMTDDIQTLSDTIQHIKIDQKEPIAVPKDKRRTGNIPLTDYERTRMIGIRVEQLKQGAHPMIKFDESVDAFKIAEIELDKNLLPFIIRRRMPNNKYEDFSLHELEKNIRRK